MTDRTNYSKRQHIDIFLIDVLSCYFITDTDRLCAVRKQIADFPLSL